jgi:hypothetical protein
LKDGTVHRAWAEYADGDPFSPETTATDEQLRNKFVTFGELCVDRGRLEQAVDQLFALEKVDDLAPLIELMCV